MPTKKKAAKKAGVKGHAKLWAYKFEDAPHFSAIYFWGSREAGQDGCVHFGLNPRRLVRVEVREL